MSTEAKVGSFTAAALAAFLYIAVQLGGYGFGADKGYEVQALFSQVNGLKPGSLVRYAGVDVGKVAQIVTDGQGAVVTLSLQEGVAIPADASFSIGSDGLMGEKFVGILPGSDTEKFLRPGDVVRGVEPRGMDQLVTNADDVLVELQTLVRSMNDIFGDERVRAAMIDSAVNAKELTENLKRMSVVLTRMAVSNEQDVREMVANLSAMSSNMAGAAATVDRMLGDLDGGGKTAADLKTAIANLSSTSRRVESMAEVLEEVVTDPETAENLKATLRNARGVTEKADRMMRQASDISAEASAELLYSGDGDRYRANAEFRLHTSPHDFLLFGVGDIGEDDTINLQIGSGNGTFGGRIGVVESKAGFGLDARISPALELSADAYDPNDFRFNLRAQYEFAPDTYLVGQIIDVNKTEDRMNFVGLRHGF